VPPLESDSNSRAPCADPPVLDADLAAIFVFTIVGAVAALAAWGIGLAGAFTFGAGLALAAGLGLTAARALGLEVRDFGRDLGRAAVSFLALPFAFLDTDLFLFICLWDFDFRGLADFFGLRADGFRAIGPPLRRGWMGPKSLPSRRILAALGARFKRG